MPIACHRDAAGFVLAGGRSTRMGQDKALIALGGRPLIAHALSILGEAGLPASICGASSELGEFAPVLADVRSGLGPLAGICTALRATAARYAVVVSADTPFLPASLLCRLLDRARITNRVVTVASLAGFAQTFPAVIDLRAQASLQAELDTGPAGCFAAFEAASASLGQSVDRVPVEMLVQSGQAVHPSGLSPIFWFLNLNTPREMERAEALWTRRIA